MNSAAGEGGVDESEALPESNRETGGGQPPNAEASSGGQTTLLQLGVFASRANADGFLYRISRQVDGMEVKTEQVPASGYFRVYLGPYASPDEARRASGWVEERTGIQPFIVRQN
ncbi:MAG: SPOR domain-containing protein [Azoarcus sp.]|nr:SPOR domain-containing protein [Azoarcus sp.]